MIRIGGGCRCTDCSGNLHGQPACVSWVNSGPCGSCGQSSVDIGAEQCNNMNVNALTLNSVPLTIYKNPTFELYFRTEGNCSHCSGCPCLDPEDNIQIQVSENGGGFVTRATTTGNGTCVTQYQQFNYTSGDQCLRTGQMRVLLTANRGDEVLYIDDVRIYATFGRDITTTSQTVCRGTPVTFSVDACILSDAGNWTYQWFVDNTLQVGATGTTFTTTFPANGTYTVHVRYCPRVGIPNQSGCTLPCINSPGLTMTVIDAPTLSIAASNGLNICTGQSTTLTASGAASFVWNTGDITPAITVNTTGTYTVTGTDNVTGCTGSASVTVTVNPNPTVGIVSNPGLTICSNISTTLTAQGANTYVWNTGATTASISVNTSGTYSVTGTSAAGCTGTASTVVTVNPIPIITITPAPSLTVCTGQSVQLAASGAATFLWSTNETTSTITVNAAGNYTVTGTDLNGCTNSAQVTVTINAAPTVTITPDPSLTICQGQSTTLTAAGGTSFIWSTGATTASISVNVAGLYQVTATAANGCTGTASVTLTVNPNPSIFINSNPGLTICAGNSTVLTASGGVSYVWSNGANTASTTVSAAGTYTVTGTNASGCTGSASVTVVLNPLPTINITPNPGLTVCTGNNVTLTASGATNYLWSTGASTPAITVNTSGTYIVTGTDANGCTNTQSATVVVNPLPNLTITPAPSLTICSGQSTTLTVSGAVSYLWNTGEVTSSITVNTAGLYSVVGTDANGCVRTTSVTVVVNPLPNVGISSNPGLTICQGASTNLTASGAVSYLWNTGAITTSINVTTPGTYTVTGTDVNGCTNTFSRTVTVNLLPTLNIAPNPSLSVCSGQSTVLTVSGATSYVWSTGATTASITVNTANTYSVTGTDANGCTNSVSAVVVINALPNVGISVAPSLTICTGQSTTLSGTGASTYAWSNGANTSSIVVNTAGVYTVTGTDNNGCTNSASVTVVVNALPTVSITPNPSLTICSGSTTTLTAAGASTYLWNTGANTASISVGVGGTYSVTGTDVNGCTATASVFVVVNPLPTISINAAPGLSICTGQSTTLTASGGNSYLWSNGQGTASITVSSAGTYSVTGTGPNGCTASASVVVVVNPLPNVVISSNPGLTICNGNATTLTGTGATSYIWSTGETTAAISATGAGIYSVTGTDANGCTNTASVTVVVRALPTITINPNPSLTICNGNSTTLTASGGISYIWSTGANTAAINVNTAGTYAVTGTDANGCTNSTAVTVVVTSVPSVNIFSNPGLSICLGRSTSLSATGAVSYLWNTGETTSSINVSSAGIYSVTGTNGGGCTNTASVTVVVNPLPTVFITSNPGLAICNGNTTTLTGNGGLNYSWSTGENTASISVGSAGVYTVTGTDVNGCTNTASVTVTVRNLPTVTISPNPSLTICNGNSTTLSASGGISYLWSNGATTTSITVNLAGNYSVTGTDNFGCTNSATVTVTVNPLPNITINSNPGLSVCLGRSTILSAVGGTSYIWSTGETTNSITVSSAGVYTVTGTNNNGCTNSATVTVVIYSLPPVSVTANPSLTICNGANTTLMGLGATSYQWSNGSNAPSISVSTAGVYTVTGTDANGCTNTASVTVVVNPLPNVIIGANPGLTICQGQSTGLTVSGANSYSWSTGETTSTITVSAAGTYTVTGTNNNGCSNTATVTVVVNSLPNVTINSNPGLTICNGSTTTLAASGAITYAWSTGETTNSIIAANPGSYTVTGTNAAGCTNSSSVTVVVNPLPTITITPSLSFTICQGQTTILTATGAATYVWSTGDVGSSISVST